MVAITGIKLATDTVAAIYRVHAEARDDRERAYLGASIIGDACERKLWYDFHWAADPEDFGGKLLRLFDTGHREEARMIEDLRRSGVEVWDTDPDDDLPNGTARQIGVSEIAGHFRGHLDGIALGVKEAPKAPHVLECKTHSPKSFKKLLLSGVAISKPMHYAQMQIYMHLLAIKRGLYLAYGKHESEEDKCDGLYAERIDYDPLAAERLIAKAHRIITGRAPPPPLHKNPKARMAWDCGYCAKIGICHEGAWPRRNCRTCIESTPEMDGDGRWSCDFHKCDLTYDDQQRGCAGHLYRPEIVPGRQIDCDPDKRTVVYALHDGTTWIDGGER